MAPVSLLPLIIQCMTSGCVADQFAFNDGTFKAVSRMCYGTMKIHSFGLHLPFMRTIDNDLAKISVLWHTPSETTSYPLLTAANEISKKINKNNPTIMMIHGFPDGVIAFKSIANIFHNMEDHNILILDAGDAMRNNYIHAVAMVQPISEALSKFFKKLVRNKNIDPRTIHLIGMSWGAQLAGRTAKNIYKSLGKKIGRITGLDPAGPCFSGTGNENILHKGDAEFVNILHVNRGLEGMVETMGHADFMVNGGGPHQPGCVKLGCSHIRAFDLFQESLTIPDSLTGRKCRSWDSFTKGFCDDMDISVFGFNTSRNTRGTYYLRTSSQSPYGYGLNGSKA